MERDAIEIKKLSLETGVFTSSHTINASAQEYRMADDKLHIELQLPFVIADQHHRITGEGKQMVHVTKDESGSFQTFMKQHEAVIFAPLLERIQKVIALVTKEVWEEEQNWQFSAPQRNPKLQLVRNKPAE